MVRLVYETTRDEYMDVLEKALEELMTHKNEFKKYMVRALRFKSCVRAKINLDVNRNKVIVKSKDKTLKISADEAKGHLHGIIIHSVHEEKPIQYNPVIIQMIMLDYGGTCYQALYMNIDQILIDMVEALRRKIVETIRRNDPIFEAFETSISIKKIIHTISLFYMGTLHGKKKYELEKEVEQNLERLRTVQLPIEEIAIMVFPKQK